MSEIKDKLITAESLKYVYDNMNNNITELKGDLSNIDASITDGSVQFKFLNLKQESINSVGDIDSADLRSWTDETMYHVLDIDTTKSRLSVPDGYVLRCYYYESDGSYSSYNEAQNQTLKSASRFKYVRFSIKNEQNKQFSLTTDVKNSVIIALKHGRNSISSMPTMTDNEFKPKFERGMIGSTGVDDDSYAFYSTAYRSEIMPTRSMINAVMPDGYKICGFYYDSDKLFIGQSSYENNLVVEASKYPFVRFVIRKSDNSVFSLDSIDEFKFYTETLAYAYDTLHNRIIDQLNVGDICPKPDSGTVGVATFMKYGDGYVVDTNGQSSSSTVYFQLYFNVSSLPIGMERGKRYKLEFTGLISRINISIRYFRNNDVNDFSYIIPDTNIGAEFEIPVNATGLQIRLIINADKIIDNAFVLPRIFDVDTIPFARRKRDKDCEPMITIIYDDGEQEFHDYILPIIQSRHVPITTGIITEYVEAGNDDDIMTYDTILDCYKKGAEVITHTISKTEPEWIDDGVRRIAERYRIGRHLLESHGIRIPSTMLYSDQSAGYPVCYNAAKQAYLSAISAASFEANKRFKINNYGEIDRYAIQRCYSDGASVLEMKNWIDNLKTAGTGWVILMRHNTRARTAMGISDTAEEDANKLTEVIDYIIEQGIQIVTCERGLHEYLDI